MATVVRGVERPIVFRDVAFHAQITGRPLMTGWEGWVEFIPLGDGEPIRTPRETTQPDFAALVHWAQGLSPVYLEGALVRALEAAACPPPILPELVFRTPAPRR